MSSLGKKRMRSDLIAFYALLRREDEEKEVLNSSPWDSVIRFMGSKPCQERIRLD